MHYISEILFCITINVLFLRGANFESHSECSAGLESCSSEKTEKTNLILSEVRREDNLILSKINAAVSLHVDANCTSCDCYMDTLKNDLKPFEKGITKTVVERVRGKGTTYVIYEKKLYRDKDCLFPSRCAGIEHFILPLLPKLENMELIINTRDWPQINRHFNLFGPVFSFSKTADYIDIMYPAWSFWEGGPAISIYPTGLGRWDLHRKSLQDEGKKWLWNKKKPIGFFRGSRTSDKRDNLVLLSRKRPDLVDAQYTKNQAWKSSADTLGASPASIVSLEHHCQYKYLFNFRGVAASFRFKHLFLCGSLVIHVGNEWIEFFYPALKPWIHYIPLSNDFTEHDVMKLMDFLKRHDDIAYEIAARGQKYVIDHLGMKEIKCYWRRLLKKYGKLLKYTVEFDKNLMEIKFSMRELSRFIINLSTGITPQVVNLYDVFDRNSEGRILREKCVVRGIQSEIFRTKI